MISWTWWQIIMITTINRYFKHFLVFFFTKLIFSCSYELMRNSMQPLVLLATKKKNVIISKTLCIFIPNETIYFLYIYQSVSNFLLSNGSNEVDFPPKCNMYDTFLISFSEFFHLLLSFNLWLLIALTHYHCLVWTLWNIDRIFARHFQKFKIY